MNQDLEIRRAMQGDLAPIAALVEDATQSRLRVDVAEAREWLYSKGLWVAHQDGVLSGVIAWQAENLVSVTDVFYVSQDGPHTEAGTCLLETIESEAKILMCEANAVLLPEGLSELVRPILDQMGYEAREFSELNRIWCEVISEFAGEGQELMVKPLRDRMVRAPL